MEPEIKKTIQVNLITLEKLGKLWISLEVYLITDPEVVVFILRKMELKLMVPMENEIIIGPNPSFRLWNHRFDSISTC